MILNSLLIGLPPPTLRSSVCSEHCSLNNSKKSKLNDDTPLLKTLQWVRAVVLSEAHGVLQDLLLPPDITPSRPRGCTLRSCLGAFALTISAFYYAFPPDHRGRAPSRRSVFPQMDLLSETFIDDLF